MEHHENPTKIPNTVLDSRKVTEATYDRAIVVRPDASDVLLDVFTLIERSIDRSIQESGSKPILSYALIWYGMVWHYCMPNGM